MLGKPRFNRHFVKICTLTPFFWSNPDALLFCPRNKYPGTSHKQDAVEGLPRNTLENGVEENVEFCQDLHTDPIFH